MPKRLHVTRNMKETTAGLNKKGTERSAGPTRVHVGYVREAALEAIEAIA